MSRARNSTDFLIALIVVVGVDIALFHCGAYFPYVQPKSFSGLVERQVEYFFHRTRAPSESYGIVVMGNSRTEAGIRESQLEADLADLGIRASVTNVAVGGSSPRSWNMLLENRMLAEESTRAVILGVTDLSGTWFRNGYTRDLDISKTALTVGDAIPLFRSYRGLENRLQAFFGTIFRSVLFRTDVEQFLRSPARRLRQIEEQQARTNRLRDRRRRNDNRSPRNLLSARLDRENQLVVEELDQFLRDNAGLRRRVTRLLEHRQKSLAKLRRSQASGVPRKPPPGQRTDPGKVQLLCSLIEDLNQRSIRVIVAYLPTDANPYDLPTTSDHFGLPLQELRTAGAEVVVWRDQSTLDELAALEYFRDTLHLNAAGAEIYTRRLARFLAPHLARENADQN